MFVFLIWTDLYIYIYIYAGTGCVRVRLVGSVESVGSALCEVAVIDCA